MLRRGFDLYGLCWWKQHAFLNINSFNLLLGIRCRPVRGALQLKHCFDLLIVNLLYWVFVELNAIVQILLHLFLYSFE